MSECHCCSELNTQYKINSASELKKALRVVRANLTDGILKTSNYWPDNTVKLDTKPFHDIEDDGPYDDVLMYYFECVNCGQLYLLSAETYHGAGGAWGPVASAE